MSLLRVLLSSCLVSSLAFAQEPDCPLKFRSFSVSRSRSERALFAETVVKNQGKWDLASLRLVIVYLDESGKEVARSEPLVKDRIRPGRSTRLTTETKDPSLFRTYRIEARAAYRGRKEGWSFSGADPQKPPEYHPTGPAVAGSRLKLPPGEFARRPEVEAARFGFELAEDGSLDVRGQIRNGLDHGIFDSKVTVVLESPSGKKRVSTLLREPLYPGEVMPFLFSVVKPPAGINGYAFDIEYQEDAKALARPQGEPPPQAEADDARGLGAAPDEKPPVPETRVKDKAKVSKADNIRIAGVDWIQGKFQNAGSADRIAYTGDVLALKLQFLDRTGTVAVQEGEVEIEFRDAAGKKIGVARRNLTPAAYKIDRGKIAGASLSEKVVAFDPKAKELWIGIARLPEQRAMSGWVLDVRFVSKEGEEWEWTELEDPYDDDPRGPVVASPLR